MPSRSELPAITVIAGAYLAGAIPFSNVIARSTKGVDLRRVGTGTVSGTGLYYQTGVKPLLLAGILDVAKGTIGPLLAGKRRPYLSAMAGGVAVAGHNWSIYLRGAGGRGISPAMGALLINGWQGSAILLGGIAAGRIARMTSIGAFVSYVSLVPVLRTTGGKRGATAGTAVLVPILLKRMMGNTPPSSGRVALIRLLFDQDTVPVRSWAGREPGPSR